MNEKILRQVEEMKKQTIGVEIEMNNITREKAARLAAEKSFGCKTVFDIAPAYLSPKSGEELRKTML